MFTLQLTPGMTQLQINFEGGAPLARAGWGDRKQFVARLPAGQTVCVPVGEAKALQMAAMRAGRRASVQRIARGCADRLFTVWGPML